MTLQTPEQTVAPPGLYLTPRAFETALESDIEAIEPQFGVIRAIRNQINTDPQILNRHRFPMGVEVEEVTFLMRWSGKGNKLIGSWDAFFDKAGQQQQYIPAVFLHPEFGGNPPFTSTKAQMDPRRVVEQSVPNWEKPELTRKLIEGVLFQEKGRRGKTFLEKVQDDVISAIDPAEARRSGKAKEIDKLQYGTSPFKIVRRGRPMAAAALLPLLIR